MKKFGRFLFPTLFLFALGCGGGGGGQTTTSGGGTTTALPAGYGVIRVNLHQGNTAAPVEGSLKALAPAVVPTYDNVRIAARLTKTQLAEILDDNGFPLNPPQFVEVTSVVYSKIVDVAGTVSSVDIAVPASDNGYVVEVISSVIDGSGNHIMLKYGKSAPPFGVVAGGSSTSAVTVNTTPIADIQGFKITLPDNVAAGANFTVSVGTDNVPLRQPFYLDNTLGGTTNIAPTGLFVTPGSKSILGTAVLTAPEISVSPNGAVGTFWNWYFQGLFFIDPTWQSDAEKTDPNWYKKWRFYFPNPTSGWGDAPLSTMLIPSGTIPITINLSPSR